MCIDYDEMEIAQWLIARGMDVNIKAAVDADGFGGHTPLFCTVVSQPNFWMNHNNKPQVGPFTQLLLAHGADPNARASLRKELHPGYEIPGLRFGTSLCATHDANLRSFQVPIAFGCHPNALPRP